MSRNSMLGKLNDSSKMRAFDTTGYKEMYLDAESIIPSEENFYSIEEIEEMADNMQLVGQLQPLLIGCVDGKYRLVAGHRRLAAIRLNNERGFVKKAWCAGKEMDQIEFMLCLLSTNAFTRKINDANLLEQTEKMKYWIGKAVEAGKLKVVGKMRDYIAQQMGVSSTKVAQIEHINKHLSEEGKQALSEGTMNFSKAYETSRLPEEEQSAVIHDKELLSSDVRAMAQSLGTPKVTFCDGDVPEGKNESEEVIETKITVTLSDQTETEEEQPELDALIKDLWMLEPVIQRYRANIECFKKAIPHYKDNLDYRRLRIILGAMEHYYDYLQSSSTERGDSI